MKAATHRLSVERSPGMIPPSIASLASGGGASAAAVAKNSAVNIATMRPR